MSGNLFYLIGSIIYAFPACLGLYYARKNGKKSDGITAQLTTSNNLTIAEMVEDQHAKLSREDTDYDQHHETEESPQNQ